jgi:hypothetical protein
VARATAITSSAMSWPIEPNLIFFSRRAISASSAFKLKSAVVPYPGWRCGQFAKGSHKARGAGHVDIESDGPSKWGGVSWGRPWGRAIGGNGTDLMWVCDPPSPINSALQVACFEAARRGRPQAFEESESPREGRNGAKQKRRCYQRRSGAPTRGTGPLRLALAGATRSGSAGVGSPWLAIRREGYAAPKWSQLERQLILGQRL